MADRKRLIDAYKLEDLVRSNSARYHHIDDVIAAISRQPTIDAVEVGSDLTTASGGEREGSEWPRSAGNEPALSGEVSAGHRNRAHGRWNEINQITTGLPWKYRCNECGCPQDYKHNYCPNCGAKMDGDGNG